MNNIVNIEDSWENISALVTNLIFEKDNSALTDLYQRRHNYLLNIIRDNIRLGKNIRVAFIVHQPAKWKEGELYKLIAKSKFFDEPALIITNELGIGTDFDKDEYLKSYVLFKSEGYYVKHGYDLETRQAKNDIYSDYDIIMFNDINMSEYSQGHTIEKISWESLSCYVPYALHLGGNSHYHFGLHYFNIVWLWLIESNLVDILREKTYPSLRRNTVITGYLKFDEYLKKSKLTQGSKKLVIYAPHWTNGNEWEGFEYGTFEWSAPIILSFMEKRQDLNFIYKPHPLLERSVEENWPQASRIDRDFFYRFKKSIEKLPNIKQYSAGDYISLFQISDILITDSVSFLGEYLPTLKPVIAIQRENAKYNEVGDKILSSYYCAKSPSELEGFFEGLMGENNIDPMRMSRIQVLNEIFPGIDSSSSQRFLDILYKKLLLSRDVPH